MAKVPTAAAAPVKPAAVAAAKPKPVVEAAPPPPVQEEAAPLEGQAQEALVNENDWRAIPLHKMAVIEKKGERNPTVIFRTVDKKTGEYVELTKESGKRTASVTTAVMKVLGSSSYLAGEGNLGVPSKYTAERADAVYKIGLVVGALDDGQDESVMLAEQLDCLRWIYNASRYLMGLVFDGKLKSFKAPIDAAKTAASKLLMREHGCKTLDKFEELMKERPDLNLEQQVEELARETFIDEAKLPIEKYPEEDSAPPLWMKKKVWKVDGFDPLKDARKQYKGESYKTLKSTLANWGEILNSMAEERLHSSYTMLTYKNARDDSTIKRPLVEIERDVQVSKDKVERQKFTIPDPFFDPVLKTQRGVEQDSLVAVSGIWSIYHGDEEETGKYGIELRLCPSITIVARQPRKVLAPKVAARYQQMGGYQEDEDEAIPAPVVVVARSSAAAAKKDAAAAAPEDGEVEQAAKRARTAEDDAQGGEQGGDATGPVDEDGIPTTAAAAEETGGAEADVDATVPVDEEAFE